MSHKSTLRVIPKLEIKEEYVVKGFQFEGVKKIDFPEVIAKKYYKDNADELIFIDTVASLYGRNSLYDVIKKTAEKVFIPMTVGGGISSIEDIRKFLNSGADKVAINTYATKDKRFLKIAAETFGSQCIVLSVQAKKLNGNYFALTDNARENSGMLVHEWCEEAQNLGVGEVLISSVDQDGSKTGFDNELISLLNNKIRVPLIFNGGAGKKEDVLDLVKINLCDAISCASLFHYNLCDIITLKQYLNNNKINVRI